MQPPFDSAARHLTAHVRGYVQGVGYRYFARRQALALGLSGYARNLDDGSVEVVAEGNQRALEEFLRLLRRGPSEAEVEAVDAAWSAAGGGLSGFAIRG